MTPDTAALHTVRDYHQRTKHRFEAYAPGPGTLDWDAQPAPFRHFEGAPSTPLPSLSEAAKQAPIAAALRRPFSELAAFAPPVAPSLDALGVLLQLALGITAWKSYGPDRWAVRANPSSGNLHPIEGYLFLRGIPGLADGLYHYCPDSNVLECRAEYKTTPGTPQVLVGLSSVMWREAWKYGERAFRYCQLDTGHAVGALRYAAALLGWPLAEQPVATEHLAHWLGLDRADDFTAGRRPDTEREEAELLLSLTTEPADMPWLHQVCATARWHGTASAIDRHPMYQWPIINEVAAASRINSTPKDALSAPIPPSPLMGEGWGEGEKSSSTPSPQPSPTGGEGVSQGQIQSPQPNAAALILRRRSAQRFDARHVMPRQDFYALLDAVLPRAAVPREALIKSASPSPSMGEGWGEGVNPCVPWDALASSARIALVLFVHRVEGLEPGLYLLPRTPHMAELLNTALDARFLRQPVENAPPHLGLQLLTSAATAELHRVARSLNCHQDIASNACFALGMVAEFDEAISHDVAIYRNLYREAGLIGQALYLHAESLKLRGTGIGCYFDDPFHDLLGLTDMRLQSLYHFTIGLALDDTRIETTMTYTLEVTS